MKRSLSLLLTCALGCSLLSACTGGTPADGSVPICDGSPSLPPSQPWLHTDRLSVHPAGSERVNEALASFGLNLLQQARAADARASGQDIPVFSPTHPLLVSPLSVALALSMTANGAEGETLAQFQEVLGGGADLEELNGACARLMEDYQNLRGSTKCTIANSLWKDIQGDIYQDFVSRCRGYYSAQVYEAELSDLRIVDDLNGWVSEKTGSLIPRIIDQPFPGETALLLVNALYLNNRWLSEFDPLSTHERDFRHENGSASRMDFLSRYNTTLSYINDPQARGVVLPYDDGRLAFFAVQPSPELDRPAYGNFFGMWLAGLEGGDLSRFLNSRKDTLFLQFAMPKFEAEWRGNLEKILPELGLTDAFIPGDANFSAMGDNQEGYWLSQVIHAAKIEVNEKGTEAAAATVVAAAGGAMPPQEGATLILDQAFLYGIVDLDTGVPLFLGTFE